MVVGRASQIMIGLVCFLAAAASAQDVLFRVPLQANGQQAFINVRNGDHPDALARVFCNQFNLAPEPNVPVVVKEIRRHLDNYVVQLQQQQQQAQLQQQKQQQQAQLAPKGAHMFSINVNVDARGTQRPLAVHDGDTPDIAAQRFLLQHGVGNEFTDVLKKAIVDEFGAYRRRLDAKKAEENAKKIAEATVSDYILGQFSVLEWLNSKGFGQLKQAYIDEQAGRQR